MSRSETLEKPAWPILVAALFAAACFSYGFKTFGRPLLDPELRWLVAGHGLLAGLTDSWIASVAGDGLMRAPFLFAAALTVPLGILSLPRPRSSRGILAGSLVLLALPGLGPAVARLGTYGLAALLAAACLLLGARGTRPCAIAIALLAAAALVLDPGAVVVPLGALCGLLALSRLRAARARVLIVAASAAAILALSKARLPLPWIPEGAKPSAYWLQACALILGAALMAAGQLVARDRGTTQTSAQSAGAGILLACVAWLAVPALREISIAPLAGVLVVPALGMAWGASARSWVRLAAGLGVLLSLASWFIAARAPVPAVPLREAALAMQTAHPGATELLAGPGLSYGAVAHAARPLGLRVVESATTDSPAMLERVRARTTRREAEAIEARLGRRYFAGYGTATGEGGSIRWAVYEKLQLHVRKGGARPNIAIVSVDTLRADHLGVYGYGRPTSPGIDRWSKGAMVYETALSTASETAPSFASLHTGRLPASHGLRTNHEQINPGNWTLARILKEAGYETAAFVSSFVLTSENCRLDLGFDLYDETLDAVEDQPIRLAPSLARAVEEWLSAKSGVASPWFLWVHTIDPHGPYTPLEEFRGTFREGPSQTLSREKIPDYQWLGTLNYYDYVDGYDAEIRQTDKYVGEIIERIEQLTSPEGTILIFVADHGEAFGEHGKYFRHGWSVHVEEIHVPLIIKDLRSPHSARIPQPVSLVDVAPTILALLGIEPGLPMDGMTLDARVARGDPIFSGWKPGEIMALQGTWKAMAKYRDPDDGRLEVYDLASDPGESHPVSRASAAQAGLLMAIHDAMSGDSLTVAAQKALLREQQESLDPEAIEKLRSLGYIGP